MLEYCVKRSAGADGSKASGPNAARRVFRRGIEGFTTKHALAKTEDGCSWPGSTDLTAETNGRSRPIAAMGIGQCNVCFRRCRFRAARPEVGHQFGKTIAYVWTSVESMQESLVCYRVG